MMLTYNQAEHWVRLRFKASYGGIAFLLCWDRPFGCITADGSYHRFLFRKELYCGMTFYSLCILVFSVTVFINQRSKETLS